MPRSRQGKESRTKFPACWLLYHAASIVGKGSTSPQIVKGKKMSPPRTVVWDTSSYLYMAIVGRRACRAEKEEVTALCPSPAMLLPQD